MGDSRVALFVTAALAAVSIAHDAGAQARRVSPRVPAVPPASAADKGALVAPSLESDSDDPMPVPAAPTAKPPAYKREATELRDGMLRIPGGRFTMGTSEESAPANERPARAVAVTSFWIDRTEVTVGAFRACVERGQCTRPTRNSPLCTYDLGDPLLPVACVGWTSANAYCLAAGKRLPREVEWENAARGTTPIKYPWGGAPGCGVAAMLAGEKTNRSCAGTRPSRVGAHAAGASPYGVQDMSGNVEEWVSDWYADSLSELSPRAGASHVLRGGGWLSAPSLGRTTTRNWGSVREAGPNVGFRCARDDRR